MPSPPFKASAPAGVPGSQFGLESFLQTRLGQTQLAEPWSSREGDSKEEGSLGLGRGTPDLLVNLDCSSGQGVGLREVRRICWDDGYVLGWWLEGEPEKGQDVDGEWAGVTLNLKWSNDSTWGPQCQGELSPPIWL